MYRYGFHFTSRFSKSYFDIVAPVHFNIQNVQTKHFNYDYVLHTRTLLTHFVYIRITSQKYIHYIILMTATNLLLNV